MKILSLLLFTLLTYVAALAQTPRIPVFISGQEGHKSYRIPALVKAPNGDILAFAEGRVHGSGDYGDVNIVLKRSSDGGKTWSTLQTVVDYDVFQAGNAAPVVDNTDPAFPQGRIFLFYNTGNNHEGEVRKGNGLREVWYKTSTDNGVTWSEAVNITTQVHRPNQPAKNPAYNFTEDWRTYANTPGHALQFQRGKYKGRLYVAANHSVGGPQRDYSDYAAHGFYTDDHGKTFKISETVALPGGNEATAAELSKGGLMLNARNQRGDIRQRIVARSHDGGQTWATTEFDKNLPDPVCQGSILNMGRRWCRETLAFCNAADTQRRDNLTLRISFDEGRTWPKSFLLEKANANEKGDKAAYSDLVKIGRRQVGVLYERNNYAEIVFTSVTY